MASESTTKPKKSQSAYEQPTPEKIAIGKRLVVAREIAGLSQAEAAAAALGYTAAAQLSLRESGHRPVTLELLIACAKLYECPADFLLGLVENSDRDPAMALQHLVASRVTADLQTLVRTMTRASVDVVRELMPSVTAGTRLACLTAEVSSAMALVVARNPKFADDMRGGATLLSKVELASKAATAYSAQVARAQRLMRVRVGVSSNSAQFDPDLALGLDCSRATRLETPMGTMEPA